MAPSTQKSNTTSRTPPDLIGDYRLRVPYQITPVARQCINLVWFDDNDREVLFRVQQIARLTPQSNARHGLAVPDLSNRRALALSMIPVWHDTRTRHRARHLFAAAAHHQARRFSVMQSVDLLAVFAGLVKGYARHGGTPLPVMSMIGGVWIDETIISAGHSPQIADFLARRTYIAMAHQYPHLASVPTDETV